jgi:hypothetical protein
MMCRALTCNDSERGRGGDAKTLNSCHLFEALLLLLLLECGKFGLAVTAGVVLCNARGVACAIDVVYLLFRTISTKMACCDIYFDEALILAVSAVVYQSVELS